MNNLFGNFLKKFTTSKETEKKAKEEEDLPDQNNLQFDIEITKPDEYLDKLVYDLKIGGVSINKYIYILIISAGKVIKKDLIIYWVNIRKISMK